MIKPIKILIFRQSSLGDVILTLSAVKALREHFPDARIDFLTKTIYSPILLNCPHLDNVFEFTDSKSFVSILKKIQYSRYDLFIDLQANIRSSVIKMKLFPVKTAKYSKRRLAREMVVRKPQLNLKVDHTINSYFKALKKVGVESEPESPEIHIPESVIQSVDIKLKDLFQNIDQPIIAICPGAKHPEKMWPYEQYAEVAHTLLDRNISISVITSSDDDLPADLGVKNSNLQAIRNFPIIEVAAILKRCKTAITNDSGLMHLSAAVGTPVVAIFGPTHPRLGFAPALDGSKIIANNVQCSPCSVHGKKACYQPTKLCFETITPDTIISAIEDML